MRQQMAPSSGSRHTTAVLAAEGSPLNLVLFGPPGAGKGTQADRFAARYGIPKISTGEILRRAVHDGTELGALVAEKLGRGALVDDELMIRVVRERLDEEDARDGFILDGFPRTVPQAEALDLLLADRGRATVIALHVMADELVDRLSARGRSDDKQRVIRERLGIYARDTAPVLDYYNRLGQVTIIDGHHSPDLVFESIEAAITRAGRARIV